MKGVLKVMAHTVQAQAYRIGRLEDTLSLYGAPASGGTSVWAKLAAKADVSRLERLEVALDQLQARRPACGGGWGGAGKRGN